MPNDGLIRYLDMFNWERVLVVSPNALRELLVTKCYDFVKPKLLNGMMIYFFGAGMPFVEGDVHRFQKKTMMPAFAFRHIKELYPVFWSMGKEMITEMSADIQRNAGKPKTTRDGQTTAVAEDQAVINVIRWFKRTTLDAMGIAGMGQDFEARKREDTPLVKAYHDMFSPDWQAALSYGMRLVLPNWLAKRMPFEANAKMEQGKETIRESCRQLIRAKSEKMSKNELSDVDVLSVAIQSGGFTDESLIDQITTFLLAGHESTAVALTWATYGLCQHPDIQKKLRDEVRAKLPSPAGNSDITSFDIDRVPYLSAVCNEILRYYDVFVWTWREAAVDTSLLGQPIPKGTKLVLPFSAIHRDRKLWGEDADKFDPERWIADKSKNGGPESNFAFMSFLHGPRSCIGEAFARAEYACLLAAWVGRFEFELNDQKEMDEKNLEVAGGFTIGPIHGLDVKVRSLEGW